MNTKFFLISTLLVSFLMLAAGCVSDERAHDEWVRQTHARAAYQNATAGQCVSPEVLQHQMLLHTQAHIAALQRQQGPATIYIEGNPWEEQAGSMNSFSRQTERTGNDFLWGAHKMNWDNRQMLGTLNNAFIEDEFFKQHQERQQGWQQRRPSR